MILIPDFQTLRNFVPNAFAAIAGQPSIFDKMEAFLRDAEIWIENNIIPRNILEKIVADATDPEQQLYFLPRRLCVLRAWRSAVPALDVVISNNGVGTVEHNNLKSASKAKIDRLLQSLLEDEDRTVASLSQILPAVEGWRHSIQAEPFTSTLFPTVPHLRPFGLSQSVLETVSDLTHRIKAVEDAFAREWISSPLMHRLRIDAFNAAAGQRIDRHSKTVVNLIRHAVLTAFSLIPDNPLNSDWQSIPQLHEANAFIISHPDSFPEWIDSDTAKRFNAPDFNNSKSSSAFFF